MKKIYLFTLFFLSISLKTIAQKEANIWYFGMNAGIDFKTGSPVALTNGAVNTNEGCSSRSDSAGNLLFYTDGLTVYNKNHVAMPNGTGLHGGGTGSSTQAALIIRLPGSYNLYYVFTVDEYVGAYGFQYSIVDMSLLGGLGNVTTKNVTIFTPCTEKLTACKKANGIDFWIVIHEPNNDVYRAYSFTSAGINPVAVVSAVGIVYNGGDFGGQIKISPQGNKLGAALTFHSAAEVYDFDNSTGVVSHPITLDSYVIGATMPYGLEFSPNGKVLYLADETAYRIFQWNLAAGTDSDVIKSRILIDSIQVQTGALQLGPDGKIYMVQQTLTYLGVINNPNAVGVACNFNDSGVSLAGRQGVWGLPSFTSDIFIAPVNANFASSDSIFCDESGKCVDFFDHSTGNPVSWKWLFPGASPDTSTLQNPVGICYTLPGTYAVTLIVSNGSAIDTLAVSSKIIFGTAPPSPTITKSGDTLYSSHAAAYQWYYNGALIPLATDSFYVCSLPGVYAVRITDIYGCSSISNGVSGCTTGIGNLQASGFKLQIYPNPAKEELIIDNGQLTMTDCELSIYNALGERIMQEKVAVNDHYVINIKTLSAGIYVVKLQNSKGQWIGKFIKE